MLFLDTHQHSANLQTYITLGLLSHTLRALFTDYRIHIDLRKPHQIMRLDDEVIEVRSDDINSQQTAYGKQPLPDIIKEIAENGAASATAAHTRIPITYRAPIIDLPIEKPYSV